MINGYNIKGQYTSFLCDFPVHLDRRTFRVTIVSAGLDQNLGITIYSEIFFFQAKAQEEDMGRR